ncbi:hypothetical protein JCM19235_291 [Vibrio maritimus]|uniref:Uncharacterized protein n=1 Tax=Vibrio maritimus TaxID=990268 RepID=A0A090S0G3_9VIBR|nr:hypothetical protein JCM19235_291 [Vibrio maritimus]
MSLLASGTLSKMRASLESTVQYRLPVGDEEVDLSPLIGKTITLNHTGNIFCASCGKKPKRAIHKGIVLSA